MQGFHEIEINLRQGILSFLLFFSLFAFALIVQRNMNKWSVSIKILSTLLGALFLGNLMSFLMSIHLKDVFYPILFLYLPSYLFIAPLVYFYIKSVTQKDFFISKKIKYHFIVPLLFLSISFILNIRFYIFYLFDNQTAFESTLQDFVKSQFFGLNIILPIQLLIYSYISINQYRNYRKNIKEYFSYDEGIKLNWLKYFVFSFILFLTLVVLSNSEFFFINFISDGMYDLVYYVNYFLFIIVIAIYGSAQNNFYEEFSKLKPIEEVLNNIDLNQNEKETYSTELSEELTLYFEKGLRKLFEEDKIFLNENLNLNDVAIRLNSNRTYLSSYLNDHKKSSFMDFVNTFRVREAYELLKSDDTKKFTIEGIANQCGFKSRATFNRAFKKEFGITPSEVKSKF